MSCIPSAVRGNLQTVTLVSDVPGLRTVGNVAIGRMHLVTESIGSCALTLTNVVAGSRVRISDQAGTTELYNADAAGSTVVVSLPVYAAGSALNDIRVRVRKGTSAPKYKPFETLATIAAGSQSIFISQEPDTIA